MNRKEFIRDILRPLVIIVGAVMLWRGTWALMDLYMFPDAPGLSALLSFVLGLIILAISHNLKYMAES